MAETFIWGEKQDFNLVYSLDTVVLTTGDLAVWDYLIYPQNPTENK